MTTEIILKKETDDEIKLPPLPSHPELINPDGYQLTRYTQIPALYDWAESYARAAIKADRQMRGEPFLYLRTLNGKPDWSEDCVADCESDLIPDEEMYAEGYGVMPLYTAPQPLSESDIPAAPAQVPSDDDLHNLWSRSGGVMRTFARALLARYGQTVEPGNGCECNQGQSCQVCDPVLEPVKVDAKASVPSDALQGLADRAYCQYIEQMSRPECKGVEYKLENDKFGVFELAAHNKAYEHLGRHRAFSEAVALLARHGNTQQED